MAYWKKASFRYAERTFRLPFTIAHRCSDDKLSQQVSVPVLHQLYPREVVSDLLSALGLWEERERKLSQLVMVYLLITWHLFRNESIRAVFLHLSAGLRLLGHMPSWFVPPQGSLSLSSQTAGGATSCAASRLICSCCWIAALFRGPFFPL